MAYRAFTPCWRNGNRVGPLAEHVDDFAAHLRDQGYAVWTAGYFLAIACELSSWLAARSLAISDLRREVLNNFLRTRSRRVPLRTDDRTALQRLIEFLKARRLLPSKGPKAEDIRVERTRNTGHEQAPAALRPVDLRGCGPVECAYERYLAAERGLASNTRREYLLYIRRFLSELKVTAWSHIKRLSFDDVTGYVERHVGDHGRASAKAMVRALRSFLGFLHVRGSLRGDLANCVPDVPNWQLATVPKFLSREEVKALLATCDRSTAVGKRDYAILLMLARLGLRAGELAELRLEDIDWQAAEIAVISKGGHEGRLPLPNDVGRAIVDYLKHGRPLCKSRRLFIRKDGPWTGFANPQSVSTVVTRAIDRAGLNLAHRGAHVLRHTFATELLRQGSSLMEIGVACRHRHPDTTAIYAKVDLKRLRSLAPPWPGGVA